MKVQSKLAVDVPTIYYNNSTIPPAAGAQGGLLNIVEDEVTSIFDLSRLPNGTNVVNSATEYVAGGLGAYYSIPRSIIDILRPGPLPYGKY